MKRLLIILLMGGLVSCASVGKVETGENTLGERMTVNLDGAWNQIKAPGLGPAQIWTMEGLPIDQLLIYTGLKDGEAITSKNSASGGKMKNLDFRASMTPDEIVSLFEGMLTRDGSSFKLLKLEPANFGGLKKGFHFEFSLIRKVDNTQLLGMGYGAVSQGELFAMLYQAPRLSFFPRYRGKVEQIALSARIKQI
ncbi:MAG TPA: hypothetical protein VMT94_02130 [Burkholderiales bacterium]|nr:hypothetical protein [Burkholderiales bacterium]